MKKCQFRVRSKDGSGTYSCGKLAVVYIKDISKKPFNPNFIDLYLCGNHAIKFNDFIKDNKHESA